MAGYDVVVVGAGLGGLTSGAILAREGRKVLVIERGNSVGGAASSYKVGELFIEASLHETSGPQDPRDPKHAALKRAGVLDKVRWVSTEVLHEIRGGPIKQPFVLPHGFTAARTALSARFPHAKAGIETLLGEMETAATRFVELSRSGHVTNTVELFQKSVAVQTDGTLSLAEKLDRTFGDDEATKCAIAANLSYYHDDPASLWWAFYAVTQGGYLQNGGHFIHSGSQRLSSALARSVKTAGNGSDVIVRRVVTRIETDNTGRAIAVIHTAKDGSDPQRVEARRVISNAAPDIAAPLMENAPAMKLSESYAQRTPSISLFGLTLGLSRPPREFGLRHYSTQLLPDWMTRLADYREGTTLFAADPGERMPPLAIADYSAIDSGVPTSPYILSAIGPDRLSNWDADKEAYDIRKKRWRDALINYLDQHFPGLAGSVVASSFNTAQSMRGYLNAPEGSAYGFAPNPPGSIVQRNDYSPRTVVPGLFLSSAYAGFGGYTGVIYAAGTCADTILADEKLS